MRTAARDYTRAFFASHRAGAPLRRQVAPLDLQFDRFGQVQRFRREIWQRLYDQAKTRPDIAQAIDAGPIGGAVGVSTGQPAVAMLDAVPLEPLRGLVVDRVQGDGGILIDRTDIDAFLASGGATVTGLSQAYATNLMLLNAVQQDNEEGIGRPDPAPDPGGEEEESDFEKAIKKAEEKQKELDEILDKATKGVKGVFGVLSAAAKQFGEDDLATSIDEYAAILLKMIKATKDFADAAISVAKVIEELDDITFDQILLGAGIGFNVAIVAVAIGLSGLMGKSKSPTQVILEQLKEIRKQIVDLRDEMRVRFDRIEKRLNTMYLGLLDRLAEMDFDLGQIEGNLDELQVSLYDLHAELQRLTTNVHAFLEAANRRDLVEAINGSLGFRERTGEDLSLSDFRAAENEFFSWGNDHAKDELQAGTGRPQLHRRGAAGRDHRPAAGHQRQLPAPAPGRAAGARPAVQRAARQSLRLDRRRRGVRAVARGVTRPPGLAGPGGVADGGRRGPRQQPVPHRRPGPVRRPGRALPVLVHRAAGGDRRLRGRVPGRRGRTAARHRSVGRRRPGAVPAPAGRDASTELRRCDGRAFDVSHVAVPVPPSIERLRLLRVAAADDRQQPQRIPDRRGRRWAGRTDRLRLGALGRAGRRHRAGAQCPGRLRAAVLREHQLRRHPGVPAQLPARRDHAGAGAADEVRERHLRSSHRPAGRGPAQAAGRPTEPVGEAGHLPGHPRRGQRAAGGGHRRAGRGQAGPAAAGLLQPGRAAVSSRAGDPIQQTGQVLNGWKLVWQAFVTAGLPLRIEANEILRSLLFGSDAILGGSDADSADSLLDDVQDIYAFFSGREEPPPPANIATDIATLAQDRATELSALLEEIVKAIEETGEPEPPEVFAPTLLRLSLLLP